MRVDILTIFPEIFESPLRASLLGKAIEQGIVDVRVHDIRDHTTDKHRQVDDESFGGGPGMVLKPEPIFAAVEALGEGDRRVILLSPAGRRLDQELVKKLLFPLALNQARPKFAQHAIVKTRVRYLQAQ